MRTRRTPIGPLLYAHRGAPLEQPENSLESFACALDAGADVLEIDVHMTSDRHVVVAHDANGTRMAKVEREIRASTLAEVKRWDLTSGSWAGRRARPVRMPSLDEVLSAFPSALLNVDVKQQEPDMLEPLIELIARHGAEARALLTSFHSATTRRIRQLGYQGATGMSRLEVARALFVPAVAQRVPTPAARMQIPLRAGPLALDRAVVIRKAHRLGLAIDFWVVNDRVVAERLLELGADGIVTDDPQAMAALYARSPRTEAWRSRRSGLGGWDPQE